MILLKESALRSCRKYDNNFNRLRYKSLRKELKSKISEAHKNFIRESEQKLRSDPSTFWSFVQDNKGYSRLPGVMNDGSQQLNRPHDIVNAFANFFASVYHMPEEASVSDENHVSSVVALGLITEHEIIKASKKLSIKRTAGPDAVPSFVVKDCIGVLASPLAHIFNRSVSSGSYPSVWKLSKVIPVLKKGDRSDIKNYRPISILSNFSKIFEIVIYNCIFPAVKCRITPNQHGFMPKRSTSTNLACFFEDVLESLDDSGQVDVIYTDFQKAFDRVDHRILMNKLSCKFGFGVELLTLVESYLSNRRCYVEVERCRSFEFRATSGVPQGSNLGPLLFLLFVNDIMYDVDISFLLYADDLKLYRRISDNADCNRLQEALDILLTWCENNRLFLNVSKCYVMSYTRRRNVVLNDYFINGLSLSRMTEIRDLGVLCDGFCSFVPHTNQLLSSVAKTYGFIVRNGKLFTDSFTLIALFNCLIRSRLEYCSIIWKPIYHCHIKRIESVQRKFLKYLVWRQDGIYPPVGFDHGVLLGKFGVEAINTRCSRNALQFLHKLIKGDIDCIFLLERISFLVPRSGSRSEHLFYCRAGRTSSSVRSPINLVCSLFNSIANRCDLFHDSSRTIVAAYDDFLLG